MSLLPYESKWLNLKMEGEHLASNNYCGVQADGGSSFGQHLTFKVVLGVTVTP